ncbi:MAG: redoxin domain-containing protein [Bacteroidetes bacterium]|jgi:peroxiredoxin|nr:redoxin domain-containing protein [Bacteroidota bacterium]
MLSALKINSFPYFDLSEIEADRDLTFRSFQKYEPVRSGDVLPDFSLEKEQGRWQQFFNGAETHGPVLFHQLLNKPLVIGFYSYQWQQYGIDLLKQLSSLQNDIAANNASLLIISSEKDRKLEKLIWDNNLSLNFYFDKDKQIAEKFRIYSEHDPIWNKFSGIDTNVPLLATYVVSASGQIEYDHIDPDFSKTFPTNEIISAVKKVSSQQNNIRNIRRSAGR